MDKLVPVSEVREAARRIAPHINRTPLIHARELSEQLGFPLYLKAEPLQRTGAFKIRGALNRALTLTSEQKSRGLVTASSGNHALGVSLAGEMNSIPVTVVMPKVAPRAKVHGCRARGATVILTGTSYDHAYAHARIVAEETGMTYLQSFDDHMIMAGQGTIALEILEDLPTVGTVVGPIGGGGLLSGLISVFKEEGRHPVQVVGVQSTGAPSMVSAVRKGTLEALDSVSTVADGIAVGRPGDLSYQIISWGADQLLAVDDENILAAMGLLLIREHLLGEPAATAGLAALLEGAVKTGDGPVVCVITGGNTTPDMVTRALSSAREQWDL